MKVYYKKNQIYLQNNLREQLRSSVEISIHPKNERELLVRETNVGAAPKLRLPCSINMGNIRKSRFARSESCF